jgi:transcriptional regulator with XRE-family HTH domain
MVLELEHIRRLRGLSQRDLAEKAGVSPATVYELEVGKRPTPRPSTLRKLAEALEVEIADLFGEPVLAGGKAEAPREAGRPETSTRTGEEFQKALARVLRPAREEALREWQASNRLESSQREILTSIGDPPEAAVAKRFVEEFSPEERPPAFAEVAVGHARHERRAEALRDNIAALRKKYLAELRKKDQRIADLKAENAQLKEGGIEYKAKTAREQETAR